MRLWLKDSERLPDPPPVQTDDRKPVLIGTGLWVVALVALLASGGLDVGNDRVVVTGLVGVGLGLLGLVYTSRRRRR